MKQITRYPQRGGEENPPQERFLLYKQERVSSIHPTPQFCFEVRQEQGNRTIFSPIGTGFCQQAVQGWETARFSKGFPAVEGCLGKGGGQKPRRVLPRGCSGSHANHFLAVSGACSFATIPTRSRRRAHPPYIVGADWCSPRLLGARGRLGCWRPHESRRRLLAPTASEQEAANKAPEAAAAAAAARI